MDIEKGTRRDCEVSMEKTKFQDSVLEITCNRFNCMSSTYILRGLLILCKQDIKEGSGMGGRQTKS